MRKSHSGSSCSIRAQLFCWAATFAVLLCCLLTYMEHQMAQNKPNYDLYGMRQTRLTRCKGLIHAGLDCRGLKSPANAFVVTDLSSEHIVDKSFEIFQRELGLTNSWFAPTPCTVYDVGGNVGYFTISSAALGCSVQSFEPLQANFQRLQLGVQANGFQNSTTLHRFGLGYEKGTAYHFRAPAHKVLRSGGIFLSGEDDALDEWKEGTNWTSTPLQVHSLDQLDFPKAPVFAVNVDAKGFESMFVSGAEKFFASCRPHLVFMELDYNLWNANKHTPGWTTIEATLAKFTHWGYRIYDEDTHIQDRIAPAPNVKVFSQGTANKKIVMIHA